MRKAPYLAMWFTVISLAVVLLSGGCKEPPTEKASPPTSPPAPVGIDCREVTNKLLQLKNLPAKGKFKKQFQYLCLEKMSEEKKACVLEATDKQMLNKCSVP